MNALRSLLTSLICACAFAILWSIAPAFADESAPTLSRAPGLSLATSDVGTPTPNPNDTPIPTGTPSPVPTVATATPTPTPTSTPLPTLTPTPVAGGTGTPTPNPNDTPIPTRTPSPTSSGRISFRSQSGTDTSGTRLSIHAPAGVQAGDMLVAAVYVDDGPTLSITPPTGWTLAHEDGTPAFEVAQLYFHQAGSSEPGSYVWTSSRAGGISGIIAAYSGVAGVEVSAGQTGTTTTAVAPSVSAANAGDWLVGAWTAWNSNVVLTAPTGMTQRRRFSAGDPLLMADKALPSSGVTGTQTASASAPPAFWTGQVLVLHVGP